MARPISFPHHAFRMQRMLQNKVWNRLEGKTRVCNDGGRFSAATKNPALALRSCLLQCRQGQGCD